MRIRERVKGLSLIEFIAIVLIAAILAVFALASTSTGSGVAGYQADELRNSIRHMQELAMTWGKPLRLTVAAGGFSVACVSAGSAPCNASPVNDPVTGTAFSVSASSGVTFGAGTLDIDELGRPASCAASCSVLSAATTLNVSGGGKTWNVQVSPITGFATVN